MAASTVTNSNLQQLRNSRMARKSGGKRQGRPQGPPPKAKKQKRDAGPSLREPISDSEDGAVLPTPYEYEEPMADEELKKNRRYDDVDVYEYELPEDFEVSMGRSSVVALPL